MLSPNHFCLFFNNYKKCLCIRHNFYRNIFVPFVLIKCYRVLKIKHYQNKLRILSTQNVKLSNFPNIFIAKPAFMNHLLRRQIKKDVTKQRFYICFFFLIHYALAINMFRLKTFLLEEF